MCGRFTLTRPPKDLVELFRLAEPPAELTPRYNVAPSQVVAVVGLKPDGRKRGLALLRWGLVPAWSNDPNPRVKPINARAETLLDRPTFRDAFSRKRCLIPADGFYEWQKAGKARRPHHVRMKGGGLFAFAGLWDVRKGGGQVLATCCIVTVPANGLVSPFHDRMPAILEPSDYEAWLHPETPTDELLGLLRPYPAERMEVLAVAQAVNSPKNDSPECLQPAA